MELNSNPEVPRKFPKLPRKFPKLPQKFLDFSRSQSLSLGSLTPSPDTQKLSLINFSLFGNLEILCLETTIYWLCWWGGGRPWPIWNLSACTSRGERDSQVSFARSRAKKNLPCFGMMDMTATGKPVHVQPRPATDPNWIEVEFDTTWDASPFFQSVSKETTNDCHAGVSHFGVSFLEKRESLFCFAYFGAVVGRSFHSPRDMFVDYTCFCDTS